jgi:hypothetical protein
MAWNARYDSIFGSKFLPESVIRQREIYLYNQIRTFDSSHQKLKVVLIVPITAPRAVR